MENGNKHGPTAWAEDSNPSGHPGDHDAGRASLRVIPVDAQRVFARWRVSPELLRAALAAGHAPEDRLVLRFRGGEDRPWEDHAAEAGWHEGFFSLGWSGGPVAAELGLKDEAEHFAELARSGPVFLPEPVQTLPAEAAREAEGKAPAAAPASLPPEIPVEAGPRAEAGPERAVEEAIIPALAGPRVVLDEAAILAAAARLEAQGLPRELLTLPGGLEENSPAAGAEVENDARGLAPAAEAFPEQAGEVLVERQIVLSALQAQLEDGGAGEAAPAAVGTAATEAAPGLEVGTGSNGVNGGAGSSARLASYFAEAAAKAPLTLEATVWMSGRVLPGYRLRLGRKEVALQPGGRFRVSRAMTVFGPAWELLETVLAGEAEEGPTLAVLAEMPEEEAPLVLQASLELRGTVHDPAYRKRLPAGLALDSGGGFRVIRPLPEGAVVWAGLVLVADRV